MKSEFGEGLCYNLGLFLAHEGRINYDKQAYKKIGNKDFVYSMWFYSAADHLYDFHPECAPRHLRSRALKFQQKVLGWRLPMDEKNNATEKDFYWAIQEAKDLLRLFDKANGVPIQKGKWE